MKPLLILPRGGLGDVLYHALFARYVRQYMSGFHPILLAPSYGKFLGDLLEIPYKSVTSILMDASSGLRLRNELSFFRELFQPRGACLASFTNDVVDHGLAKFFGLSLFDRGTLGNSTLGFNSQQQGRFSRHALNKALGYTRPGCINPRHIVDRQLQALRAHAPCESIAQAYRQIWLKAISPLAASQRDDKLILIFPETARLERNLSFTQVQMIVRRLRAEHRLRIFTSNPDTYKTLGIETVGFADRNEPLRQITSAAAVFTADTFSAHLSGLCGVPTYTIYNFSYKPLWCEYWGAPFDNVVHFEGGTAYHLDANFSAVPLKPESAFVELGRAVSASAADSAHSPQKAVPTGYAARTVASAQDNQRRPSVAVMYHYGLPDDVVSAVHIGELCEGLAQRGWDVTSWPSNRGCRDERKTYLPREILNGVKMERVWRPRFKQASGVGRLLNVFWMLTAWSLRSLRPGRAPDVVLIGTEPILSVLTAKLWKTLRPKTKVIHWCFDLYPEAAIADGLIDPAGTLARSLETALRSAYQACDSIVDIGPCMRQLLEKYGSDAQRLTLVPWALEEPASALPSAEDERRAIFGDASLAVMYSGTFGRAHSCEGILEFARAIQPFGGRVAFSARGNRIDKLRDSISASDSNISFIDFAPPGKLQERLASADIHIVSLRELWTGTVVPSKFFGALAIGRPVLFFGSPESAIAKWIQQFNVGWVWDSEHSEALVKRLRWLASDPTSMAKLAAHCHAVYRDQFSRKQILDSWDAHLRGLLQSETVRATESLGALAQVLYNPNAVPIETGQAEPAPVEAEEVKKI